MAQEGHDDAAARCRYRAPLLHLVAGPFVDEDEAKLLVEKAGAITEPFAVVCDASVLTDVAPRARLHLAHGLSGHHLVAAAIVGASFRARVAAIVIASALGAFRGRQLRLGFFLRMEAARAWAAAELTASAANDPSTR